MHVFVAVLQIGVVPVHALVLSAVHATHLFVVVLHAGVPPEQLVSDEHGSHLPLFVPAVMQTPVRHCGVPVHVPSPGAKPHALSVVSHAPLAQMAVPTADEQMPVSAGEWLPTVGIGVPFGRSATHAPALHQLPLPQSESRRHVALHAPVVLLQNGVATGQGNVADETPLFPLHPVHAFVVVLQIGVLPVHAVAFVPVHATHWFVVRLHAGVVPLQFPSPAHGSHLPVFVPVVMH
jgi:hypothetical protein